MGKITIGGVLLGACFWILGSLVPASVLLNFPFGVGYYVADRLGMWKPGLMWVVQTDWLPIICFFVWPMLVSFVLGIFVSGVCARLWRGGTKWSRLSTIIFVIALFGLILSVRVDPGSYLISYFGYWTSNY